MVRFAYMDEAGISNPEHEPYVVVCGIIVHGDDELNRVESALDALVRDFIPVEYHGTFVFHAMHLFNGGGPVFKRDEWPLERRLEIADRLAAIPRLFNLPITFGSYERKSYPDVVDGIEVSNRDKLKGSFAAAFLPSAMQVEMWMRLHAQRENCVLVIENNDLMRNLINEVQDVYRKGQLLRDMFQDGNEPTGAQAVLLPFEKIRHRPLWDIKQPSSVLQIADFAAYVWKRHIMEDAGYDRFWKPISA